MKTLMLKAQQNAIYQLKVSEHGRAFDFYSIPYAGHVSHHANIKLLF